MARLQCRSCGFDKEIEWDGRLVCPPCGSTNARVAAATTELSDAEIEMITQSKMSDGSGEDAGKEMDSIASLCAKAEAAGLIPLEEHEGFRRIASEPSSPEARRAVAEIARQIGMTEKQIAAIYGSAEPYQLLKRTLGREPTARDVEIYIAARRASKRDDDE
jgi:hypothetical protein